MDLTFEISALHQGLGCIVIQSLVGALLELWAQAAVCGRLGTRSVFHWQFTSTLHLAGNVLRGCRAWPRELC